jgi:prophage DNA circulation protein
MGYRDRLRQASYRGAVFHVESHAYEGGRRATVLEYTQRESPGLQDNGRLPERYRITAYLVGDDYMERRDALIDVARRRPVGYPHKLGGLLVHPYLGERIVHCERFTLRESQRSGAYCTIELEFVEVGRDQAPEPSGRSSAASAADQLEAAAGAGAQLNPVGSAEVVRESISEELARLGQKLLGLDVLNQPTDQLVEYTRDARRLVTQASTLATSPADAISLVRSSMAQLASAAGNLPAAVLAAYSALFGAEPLRVIPGVGTIATRANANRTAIVNLQRQLALAGALRAAARVSWDSRDAALGARRLLLDEIEQLEGCSDPETCAALARARGAAVAALPPSDQSLPRLREVILPETTPALVLAQRYYQDARRADEITARNRLAHPLFIPAGPVVLVLARG